MHASRCSRIVTEWDGSGSALCSSSRDDGGHFRGHRRHLPTPCPCGDGRAHGRPSMRDRGHTRGRDHALACPSSLPGSPSLAGRAHSAGRSSLRLHMAVACNDQRPSVVVPWGAQNPPTQTGRVPAAEAASRSESAGVLCRYRPRSATMPVSQVLLRVRRGRNSVSTCFPFCTRETTERSLPATMVLEWDPFQTNDPEVALRLAGR